MQPRHMPSTNKGTLLSHIQHDVQDAQVLLCRAHDIHWYMELFLPRCRIWHFSLMNFMRLMSAHFSSLSWSLWVAAQSCGVSATPPIVVSSANFQRVHFAPSVRSLMKKLKRTGSTIDSVGGVHPGSWWKGWYSMTHIIFLWAWPLIQFSVHLTVYSSSLCFICFFMRILWKVMQKALLMSRQTIHTTLPSSTDQSFHFRCLSGWSSMTNPCWNHADYSR